MPNKYTAELIADRFRGGYNYFSEDKTLFGEVSTVHNPDRIDIYILSRDKGIQRLILTETEFNQRINEEDPICGLSSTKYGLVYTSTLPRRKNRHNWTDADITWQFLSHPEAGREGQMIDAFLPVYQPLEKILTRIETGRGLGGALNQFYGIAVTEEANPQIFFGKFPVGEIDITAKRATINRSGWSYFEEAASLLNQHLTVVKE